MRQFPVQTSPYRSAILPMKCILFHPCQILEILEEIPPRFLRGEIRPVGMRFLKKFRN
jgi:hypothetical protein